MLAGVAGAADSVRPPDSYVVFGGGYMAAGDRDIDYGINFDLGYAGRLGTRTWWEISVFTSVLETGIATEPDWYQSGLGLDLIQSFSDESRTHLFAIAGAGVALNDVSPDDEDGNSFYGNAGLGVRGPVWSNWGVRPRADLRYVYDTFGEGVGDITLNFGLEIPPKREKVVERVVEVEKIVEVPVEVEKIVEKEVVCVVPPTAEAQPQVQAAESDTDRDGVPDDKDRCSNTLSGAKVDENGCIKEEQKISLPNIEFESGSTVLAAGGKEKLEAVVSFLQTQTDVTVDVFGHTDAQGKDAYNLKLSDGRARAVMDYLVSRGVADGRLSSRGFGETQPIATNETAEGRALNRRVELLVRMKKK
jgi:OOP family OmpA-OmpF porin